MFCFVMWCIIPKSNVPVFNRMFEWLEILSWLDVVKKTFSSFQVIYFQTLLTKEDLICLRIVKIWFIFFAYYLLPLVKRYLTEMLVKSCKFWCKSCRFPISHSNLATCSRKLRVPSSSSPTSYVQRWALCSNRPANV